MYLSYLSSENQKISPLYLFSFIDSGGGNTTAPKGSKMTEQVWQEIARAICKERLIPDLFMNSRSVKLVEARALFYVCLRHLNYSMPEIGRLAGKDHTTVMHACIRFDKKHPGEGETYLRHLGFEPKPYRGKNMPRGERQVKRIKPCDVVVERPRVAKLVPDYHLNRLWEVMVEI